jgi:hypothetical protein
VRKPQRRIQEPRITLGERVVGALLTPLLFNAAVIISVAMLSKRTHYMLFHLGSVYRSLGAGAIMLLVAPAVVGFLAGADGTARIFGHAFWTHHENHRSVLATALVWAVFAAAVFWVNTRIAG